MLRWLSRVRVAVRSMVFGARADRELDEELQYHLERQIDEGRSAGLSREEARYAALRTMGAIARNREECRDLRRPAIVREALGDLRYAARALGRHPGFGALVIGIMAVGIGANTAVFSVVNAVLLKPLPYSGADRIVSVATWNAARGEVNPLVTIANFRDWRDQSRSFEAMAAYRSAESPVTTADRAEYVRVSTVDASLFRAFGVEPQIGRIFTAAEQVPDSRLVVISDACWQNRFGRDAGILTRTLRVGLSTYSIVGVMPPGFEFPGRTELWVPFVTSSTSRTSHNLLAVGRVRPGVALESAQAELTTIAAGLERQYPESNKGRGVIAIPLQDVLVGDVRRTLYLLWGVVGVVLVIACANTATLLLGKATMRAREMAVRTALGASRSRIVRQLITESLLLAIVAGAGGVIAAAWGAKVLAALTPADIVRSTTIGIDRGVLAFTLAVSVLTSVLFGLIPALHASRVELSDAVKQGGGRALVGAEGTRTRGLLVVCQIALAVVLLTGAGLLAKSLVALRNTDLGFRPENVLVARATGVRAQAENNAFFGELLSRVAVLPGVVAAGATSAPPGDLSTMGDGAFFIDRIPAQRDRERDPRAMFIVATPNAFAALGMPVTRGRDFSPSDTAEAPLVAIVNEALVRRGFGSQEPIGRTIHCSFDRPEAMTIVGVVGDVRQRNPAIPPEPVCYMPNTQHSYNGRTLSVVVRTAGDPRALAESVRRAAADVSPEIPMSFTTMEELVSRRVDAPRFRVLLFGLFAGVAVCLAVAGVYGVMAYSVQQRSQEIALRMALGAERASVLQMILRRGLVLTLAGLAGGLASAAAVTRLLSTMLYEVEPFDAPIYAAVAVLLGAVTLAAGYVPARRAASVDPVAALRAE